MAVKALLSLLIILLIASCSTVSNNKSLKSETNALLAQAHRLSQSGSYTLAINKAKQSIKQSQHSSQITNELIEGYDDLGLYYFQSRDYQKSTYYQSIAVVLSHINNPKGKINQVYLERLGWAYGKYDPTFDLTNVIKNPLLLVCKNRLNINMNISIKRFIYKQDKALSPRRKNKKGMHRLKEKFCTP